MVGPYDDEKLGSQDRQALLLPGWWKRAQLSFYVNRQLDRAAEQYAGFEVATAEANQLMSRNTTPRIARTAALVGRACSCTPTLRTYMLARAATSSCTRRKRKPILTFAHLPAVESLPHTSSSGSR